MLAFIFLFVNYCKYVLCRKELTYLPYMICVTVDGDAIECCTTEYGIGSAVMEELLRFIKERGTIRNVSLSVKASSHNAIRMYKKFEFKKIGVHKNYFNVNGNFHDEIIMDLYI